MSGAELLERAINYAYGAIDTITPDLLTRGTPCSGWDLRALLDHLNDSLAALYEAVDGREVAAPATPCGPPPGDGRADPTVLFRYQACRLLGALTAAEGAHDGTGSGEQPVGIGGHQLTVDLVSMTGAVEIAVHGWDVYRASGRRTPIPEELALDLLVVCPLLVSGEDRSDRRFAERVPVCAGGPSDWLVAHLGRDPNAGSYRLI
ncbi:DinB family protein [Flindersiella endophytica]